MTSYEDSDVPKTEKEAAVAQWEAAVSDIPDDHEHKETFENAHIHDSEDRRELEELIHYEIDSDVGLALEDAFHDLKQAFEDFW